MKTETAPLCVFAASLQVLPTTYSQRYHAHGHQPSQEYAGLSRGQGGDDSSKQHIVSVNRLTCLLPLVKCAILSLWDNFIVAIAYTYIHTSTCFCRSVDVTRVFSMRLSSILFWASLTLLSLLCCSVRMSGAWARRGPSRSTWRW